MNKNLPMLIVMLTYDDRTVKNAYEIFEQNKDAKSEYWGFKEAPLSLEEMKKLYAFMKACGKRTVLEVVEYTEQAGLNGAKMAVECGVDLLLGTKYYDSINNYCKQHNLKYMPYVGEISKRPSILSGSIDDIIAEAKEYLGKGVYGFDLLGYRYTGDAEELNQRFVSEIDAPVCIAGSVDSYQRLDEVKMTGTYFFTIGSAFFDNKFDGSFSEQIDKVIDYMEK